MQPQHTDPAGWSPHQSDFKILNLFPPPVETLVSEIVTPSAHASQGGVPRLAIKFPNRPGEIALVKISGEALTRWLSWLERRPVYQKIVGYIPGQGTYLGCGSDPRLGHI